MPTPTFLCGFEHGIAVTGAAVGGNNRIWTTAVVTGGTPGIGTSTPKNGARCLDIPASSGAAAYLARAIAATPTIGVASFYIRFVGSLPTADCRLFTIRPAAGSFPFLQFQSSDSKLYAGFGPTVGASGVVVVPDVWYLIDFKTDVGVNPRTCDVSVDGVALGQATVAVIASTITDFRIGKNVDTTTANVNVQYDDIVISATSGDFPLGHHEVMKLALDSDGTHSFTANDFIRGDAGAAIIDGGGGQDNDVWTLLDEIPWAAVGTTDSVQQNVIRSTGYIEVQFEPSPREVDAWGVQFNAQFDADGTNANTQSLRAYDGTTEVALWALLDVSENAAEVYLSAQRATNPSGGAWTKTAIGLLRCRWGFSTDVTGSPIIHALMAEVAFPSSAMPVYEMRVPQVA